MKKLTIIRFCFKNNENPFTTPVQANTIPGTSIIRNVQEQQEQVNQQAAVLNGGGFPQQTEQNYQEAQQMFQQPVQQQQVQQPVQNPLNFEPPIQQYQQPIQQEQMFQQSLPQSFPPAQETVQQVQAQQPVNQQEFQQQAQQPTQGVMVDGNAIAELMKTVTVLLQQNQNLKNGNSQPINFDMNNLGDILKTAIVEANNVGTVMPKTYTIGNIPKHDILERPVVFFAFTTATTIYDDVRDGFVVQTPYRPIPFKTLFRYEDPKEKGKIISQCAVIVKTKSEVEFIRNHSLFGIKYFERMDSSKTVDQDQAERLIQAFNEINGLNQYEVQQRCITAKINIDTNDFTELKRRLAYYRADRIQLEQTQARKMELDEYKNSMQIASEAKGETGVGSAKPQYY